MTPEQCRSGSVSGPGTDSQSKQTIVSQAEQRQQYNFAYTFSYPDYTVGVGIASTGLPNSCLLCETTWLAGSLSLDAE